MATILRIDYAKKLGLPNYSSHQCSVSLQVEISDPAQVASESHRLFGLLQAAVDADLQQVGFLPEAATYGMHGNSNGDDHDHVANGRSRPPTDTNGHGRTIHTPDDEPDEPAPAASTTDTPWACSDKQRELVLKLVSQHHLDKKEVEVLAHELFGAPVKTLNRLQASGLIEELLARHGKGKKNGNGNGRSTPYRRAGRE